ncbi:MAG: hypothetical protein NC912_05105 [Candidatus Omnitrophica bacterium]|nr:hypothetical protein [Candidatus Omnitrophota bacterium]
MTYLDNIKVNIIGIKELLKSKKKIKRALDLVDVENLRLRLKLKRSKDDAFR